MLLQIMPTLQILLDKGKVTFNNSYNKQKRFWLLNDVTALPDCFKQKNLSFPTIEATQ